MEVATWAQRLGWAAVGVSGLAVLYALVVTYAAAAAEPRARPLPSRRGLEFLTGLAVLFGAGLFLATRPKAPPFSAGQGLGEGFLIGAVAALLAAWFLEVAVPVGASGGTARRPFPTEVRGLLRLQPSAVTAGLIGWAAIAVFLGLRWLKADLLTALPGVAAGAWFVAFIVASPRLLTAIADCRLPIADFPESGQSQIANRKSQIASPLTTHSERLLWLFAASLSALAFGTILAAQNAAAFEATPETVRLFPTVVATGLILALALSGPLASAAVAGSLTRLGSLLRAASVVLLLAVSGAVAFFGAQRLAESPAPSFPFLCGLLTGALALGLAPARPSETDTAGEDKGTRGQGDKGIGRGGDREMSPRHPVTLSPRHLVPLSPCHRTADALRQGFVLALLLLGTVVAAFLLQRGLGIALAMLGVLTAAAWQATLEFAHAKQAGVESVEDEATEEPTQRDAETPCHLVTLSPCHPLSLSLHAALSFLLLMLLFRLFYERYPLGRGRVDLYLQSPFIGLLWGLAVPFGLGALGMEVRARLRRYWSGVQLPPSKEADALADLPARWEGVALPTGPWLDWLLTGGFGMIAAPALTVFLWGTAGSAGFLAGLVVYAFLVCLLAPALGAEGGLGRSPAPTAEGGLGRSPAPTGLSALLEAALFGLPLLGLVTLQGTHLLEPASHAARNVKVIVLVIALGLALVWSLARWLSARRAR